MPQIKVSNTNKVTNKIFIILLYTLTFLSFASAQNTPTSLPTTTPSSSTTNTIYQNGSSTAILKNTYVQIIDGCKWNHVGSCISVRTGPGIDYKKIYRLRNGIVLKASHKIETGNAVNGSWYKITFKDEKVNKADRIKGDWYVNAKYVKLVENVKPEIYEEGVSKINDSKRMYINIKTQTLEAYEGDKIFLKTKISTGLKDSPTLPGEYYIHYKTPSRYMQDDTDEKSTSTATETPKDYYDLPGVPFDLYFDEDGKAIHGAYWHNNFGRKNSHGCINLPIAESEKLYRWAEPGTAVIVK